MIFTGLFGYCWAKAALEMRHAAPSAMARKIVIIGTFSLIGRYRPHHFLYWRRQGRCRPVMGPGQLAPSLRDNRADCKFIVAAAEPARGRQCAEDRAVRGELFVGPGGDQGAGALVRNLGRQPAPGADGRRGRHRLHAADRPLEGLRRRHRLSGGDARNRHLGDRSVAGDQAHHRVRHRARAAVSSDHRGEADGHRRPHRRRPLRAQHRGRLERGRVRDVRRRAARTCHAATNTRRSGSTRSS